MCECARPKVLRASRRRGVLIIPKSAPLLNLEGWLIDATGYAPGLPSPMRPISVLAQNLGGIPRVLIQVLFSPTYLSTKGRGGQKAMKACKTPVCYVAKNTNLTHCHSPPTQLKLQEKGGTVTRPLQVLHTLQWHHPGGRALGNWL